MNSLADFNKLVVSLIEVIKNLISIEQDKLNAVTNNNLEKLDGCIKDEQVQVMKLKGIEKSRVKLLSSLGYEGLTFKQIISTLEGEEKKESQKLFDSLKKVTKDFNSVNSSAKTAIEVNLYAIDMALNKLNKVSDSKNMDIPINSKLSNKLV